MSGQENFRAPSSRLPGVPTAGVPKKLFLLFGVEGQVFVRGVVGRESGNPKPQTQFRPAMVGPEGFEPPTKGL